MVGACGSAEAVVALRRRWASVAEAGVHKGGRCDIVAVIKFIDCNQALALPDILMAEWVCTSCKRYG